MTLEENNRIPGRWKDKKKKRKECERENARELERGRKKRLREIEKKTTITT